MNPHSFILIGRSGCGKGTQSELLEKYLLEHDKTNEVFHLETGTGFRDLIRGSGYTNDLSKERSKSGALQPQFLAVWVWADLLIRYAKPNQHIIFDGAPRRLREAGILDRALHFYKREKRYVIYLDVSQEWSLNRMLSRKRPDDNSKEIEKRMDWFEEEVKPVIAWYKENPDYRFIKVNGEQPVEKVYQDIIQALDLKFEARNTKSVTNSNI